MANVFNTDVYTFSNSESAAFGAAYRALHAYTCWEKKAPGTPYHQVISESPGELTRVATPDGNAVEMYAGLMKRYAAVEDQCVN